MPDFALVFTRQERLEVTAVAILTLATELTDQHQILAALKRATTKWVTTTEGGRELWQASYQDLNIGDLANDDAFAQPEYQSALAEQGLAFVRLDCAGGEWAVNYDHVLASPEGDDEDEDDLEEDAELVARIRIGLSR